jgi:hypothetical protein
MTTREEFDLLAGLASVNTRMGRAVQAILAYQQEHGQLPAPALRALGELLGAFGNELTDAASRVEKPLTDTPARWGIAPAVSIDDPETSVSSKSKERR